MSEEKKKSYKSTLNLPKTSFAMKANLVQREPEFQKRWAKMDIYQRMQDMPHPAGKFVLHDGPPYANGSIHLGHLLNKVLKDLVVRSKTQAGYESPFVPGWDCHGLPIEHKVMKELGPKAKDMDAREIRKLCKKDASKYVKLQSRQMQRLGTVADYDDPYLTMVPRYESGVLNVFASLVDEGIVYNALKPVHWSIANQTALADAELEYFDREDTSVYVLFELIGDRPEFASSVPADQPIHLMIWTTTPWTLPANMAVAANTAFVYGLYSFDHDGSTRYAIVETSLAEKVLSLNGDANMQLITDIDGSSLLGLQYQHPFVDRVGKVVAADYVTNEDGTGLVHTAPGHGVEDYQTGLREGIEIYCPVQADGTFDDRAPEWLHGKSVWDANELVINRLRGSSNMFHDHQFMHSYPHDWRSKTPVIFRATKQWFISVDKAIAGGDKSLQEMALETTREGVRFIPEWGRNRMRGMLESRPDWCISRQRAWGLPIPAFLNADEEPLLTGESVRAVSKLIAEKGADVWFVADAEDLLTYYDVATDDQAPQWAKDAGNDVKKQLTKVNDIFDVWFESGSSWNAVLRQRDMGYPADLYLEGSDQHRGWFQLSLLPGLGVTQQSPFKTVLTHGFMVDKDGKKMSKSGGNALDVDELMKVHGADVCRWWVSSLNAANDIKVDESFFKLAGEEYRKVRNTVRFLLSNLNDFDVDSDRYELTDADATSIDAWALQECGSLVKSVRDAYDAFDFRRVNESVYNFCNQTMSAVYLAAVKDRLYCDKVDSPRRRRTQTVIHAIADNLIRIVSPILVHTADEAFLALYGKDAKDTESCVHLVLFPDTPNVTKDDNWDTVMSLRERIQKALEDAKSGVGIDNPLDAGVEATVPAGVAGYVEDLADLVGVSRFTGTAGDDEQVKIIDLREEPRCERSWKRDGTVKERSDGGFLSDRDAEAIGV